MAEEGLKKTKNDLIHIGCPIPFDVEEFLKELDGLLEAAYKNIRIRHMSALVNELILENKGTFENGITDK